MVRMAILSSKRPQGQLPRYSRQLESVRRIFPFVAAVIQHYPLHPHEVRAERAWLISEKSLANCDVEEHILCHKGAYMGKNGITRDRTGKLWYYRNLKR